MNLRQREDRIFQKYRSMSPTIIPDGALGKEYETARRRLLVILKEPMIRMGVGLLAVGTSVILATSMIDRLLGTILRVGAL